MNKKQFLAMALISTGSVSAMDRHPQGANLHSVGQSKTPSGSAVQEKFLELSLQDDDQTGAASSQMLEIQQRSSQGNRQAENDQGQKARLTWQRFLEHGTAPQKQKIKELEPSAEEFEKCFDDMDIDRRIDQFQEFSEYTMSYEEKESMKKDLKNFQNILDTLIPDDIFILRDAIQDSDNNWIEVQRQQQTIQEEESSETDDDRDTVQKTIQKEKIPDTDEDTDSVLDNFSPIVEKEESDAGDSSQKKNPSASNNAQQAD